MTHIIQSENKSQEVKVVHKLTHDQKKDLLVLYKNAWWSCDRTLENIETILKNSSLIIGLVDPADDRLIGFTRILSDYFEYAYIYDVIVLPNYRGLKLGKKILELALQHPDIKDIKFIELTCTEQMKPFYERFGFSENYGETIAMRRRKNKAAAS